MKIRIVVVDDEETDRYLAKRAVESLEFDTEFVEFEAGDDFVSVVKEPDERLAKIGTSPQPIVVLLDINLPRMSGFEVLESMKDIIKNDDQMFVFTMYSSSDHAEDRSDALKYDFVKDYIVKPVTAERLSDIIKTHCIQS